MEIQQLRYIWAVYQERNFSRAAERVHISQPTLSQQIKKLEKELGVTLFERSSRRVKLTPEGEVFIPQMRQFLESFEAAVADIKNRSKEISGRIRLAAIPTMAPYVLPGLIKRLRHKAPGIILEIHELTTSLLLSSLKRGDIDIGLLSLPIDEKGMTTQLLATENFYLAVFKKHPLARKRKITTKDIMRERMLILQEGHCFRDQSLSLCKMSASDPHVIFQGSSLGSVMKMASTGEGITVVPEMAIDTRAYPDVQFIPFSSPSPTRDIGLVWRMSTPLSRGHHLLFDLIEQELKDH